LSAPLLEARRLTKRFPGVVALRDVNFDLQPGEIHALCGENGAGKSTLIKLLAGIHPFGSYEGELLIRGQPGRFRSIRDAEAAGVAVITQEFALVDELSVGENIFLGRFPRRGLRLDWLELHRRATAALTGFGLTIASETRVGELGVGEKQLVEILRAMDKKSRILVLDEPTAALTSREVETLVGRLQALRTQSVACIYISHKLEEVFALADRITVLRDGATVGTLAAREATIPGVIKLMAGRELGGMFPARSRKARSAPASLDGGPASRATEPVSSACASPILSVRGLSVARSARQPAFLRDISFDLMAGEVLGFGGLMGSGRTELLMHLFGAWGVRMKGEVTLGEEAYPNPCPEKSLQRGLALVSEDRRRDGLVLAERVGFNLSLASLSQFTRATGRLDPVREYTCNQRFVESLRIKTSGLEARVAGLSGGNQQKVVLGRALMTGPRIVLLDEPTRGIDVGAKREIYELIEKLRAEGKAVMLVSSELAELIGLSDRIIMLAAGRIAGEFAPAEFAPEKLLAAALGQSGANAGESPTGQNAAHA
jgi:D-xylose transport system ATP-binding protein